MISEFRFPDAEELISPASRAAKEIARLKQNARRSKSAVIYVNDTHQVWESDQEAFLARCSQPGGRGRHIVQLIRPSDADFFLFKPRHSAFYETALHSILVNLGARALTLTGISAHQCVLFTAMDAHIRGYRLTVPRRAIAAPRASQTRHALAILEAAVDARII
jgi:nicotinamidase-related amidase